MLVVRRRALDVRIALGRVRDEVLKKTNGEQEPYVYGSLGGDIIALVPAKGTEPDPNHASTPSPPASPRPVTKAQTLDLGTPISLHDNWAVYCQRVGSADRCALAQSVRAEDGNFGLTAILLRGDRGQLMMRVIAPTCVLLASGLGLRVDEETIGNTGFVRCGEYGCVAEVEVDGALLKKLEVGKKAMFVIFQTPDAGLGVPITLSGLAAGLANLR